MTAQTLKSYSCKDLAEMARKRGVPGWHAMRKEQLIKALLRLIRTKAPSAASRKTAARRAPSTNGHASGLGNGKGRAAHNGRPDSATGAAGHKATGHAANGKPVASKPNGSEKAKDTPAARKLQRVQAKAGELKNLAGRSEHGKPRHKDRLVLMVRDPYWLHAYWEVTRQSVERAQAALGQEWHGAKPILRLLEISAGSTTSAAATAIRDIEIHGGVNNWYIDVHEPPKSFRIEIGYRGASGKFHVLARSNVVSTPKAGVKDALDENWTGVAEDYERIYAMSGGYRADVGSGELQELFEERLRRPMGSTLGANLAPAIEGLLPRKKDFHFEIDAELIVYGSTEADAHVTLQGEPVKLRDDGSFTVRFSMPNCRQVIPAVAASANGLETRTIVLAVERNTKVMEPLIRDSSDP